LPAGISGVVDANGKLPLLEDRRRRADAGDALDGGGIDAAMDDAPRREMLRAQVNMRRHPCSADLFEHEAVILEPRSRWRQACERGKGLWRASGRVLIGHHGLAFSYLSM